MNLLLYVARMIDALNDRMAIAATWAVLISCLISAGNALIRYSLSISSNGFLEIQWYLFAVVVMLGAAQVLRLNEHVRVDVVYGIYPTRTKVWVDLLGLLFFLMPVMLLLVYLGVPLFLRALETGEVSSNAGGLIRWPVILLIPLGFALVSLQGISEIIKRVGWLTHRFELDTQYERPLQ